MPDRNAPWLSFWNAILHDIREQTTKNISMVYRIVLTSPPQWWCTPRCIVSLNVTAELQYQFYFDNSQKPLTYMNFATQIELEFQTTETLKENERNDSPKYFITLNGLVDDTFFENFLKKNNYTFLNNILPSYIHQPNVPVDQNIIDRFQEGMLQTIVNQILGKGISIGYPLNTEYPVWKIKFEQFAPEEASPHNILCLGARFNSLFCIIANYVFKIE